MQLINWVFESPEMTNELLETLKTNDVDFFNVRESMEAIERLDHSGMVLIKQRIYSELMFLFGVYHHMSFVVPEQASPSGRNRADRLLQKQFNVNKCELAQLKQAASEAGSGVEKLWPMN